MKELDDLGEDIEFLETSYTRFPYPAVTIGERYAYFNKHTFNMMPKKVRWATSSEYILIIPSNSSNAYKTYKRTSGYQCAIPPELLREKKIRLGNYRLYKYKDGFAFKRYEQVT